MEVKEVVKMRNRGDITIPISIRKHNNLKIGDHLLVISDEEKIVIKKLKL